MIGVLALGNVLSLILFLTYRSWDPDAWRSRVLIAAKSGQIVGWVLMGCRSVIPDLASIYLGNIIIYQGFALEALVLTSFSPRPRLWERACLTVSLGGGLVFCLFARAPHDRVMLASGVVCLIFLLEAGALLSTPGRRPPERVMGVFNGLLGGLMGYRALVAALGPGDFSLLSRNGVQSASFLLFILAMMVNGTGAMILMLEEGTRRLRQSQVKFATIFRSAPCAILLTDLRDGKIQDVNAHFAMITGYVPQEAIGRTTLELGLFPDEGSRRRYLQALGQSGAVQGFELVFGRKGGELSTGILSGELVDLGGEAVIVSCVVDITERKRLETERDGIIRELQAALSEVKVLSGLLPICASCKKIRDDQGYWNQIEGYLMEHAGAAFTHGLCPDCVRHYFPDYRQEEPPPG